MKISWWASRPYVHCDIIADELQEIVNAERAPQITTTTIVWDLNRLIQELRERKEV